MAAQPWYRDGLRFQCSQCGNCCTGEPGFVWVNQQDIDALAAELGMDDSGEFEEAYVRKVGIRRSLCELSNGDCVLFDSDRRCCKAYEARPRQCRTWPFWESNVRTRTTWEETCRVCPGSGQGALHQLEVIQAAVKVIRV